MAEPANPFEAVRAMMLENLERVQSATQSYIDTVEKAMQGLPGANQEHGLFRASFLGGFRPIVLADTRP
jgi:hypothetical protein